MRALTVDARDSGVRRRDGGPILEATLVAGVGRLRVGRGAASGAEDEAGDDGTNDLLISNVIRTNELQVWFVAEHVVDEPLVHADGKSNGHR